MEAARTRLIAKPLSTHLNRVCASTSGTIVASRKLSFTDLIAAIAIFVNGARGVSALPVSRDLDVQYKSAFVLSHKLREARPLRRQPTP